MEVNTHKHQMVGQAVNDAAFAAFPTRQTRELTIRVVERIRANVERHTDHVDAQITVVIKVARNDAADARQQRHGRRRHFEMCEKLGQPKSYRPVKVQVENSLHLACFVSRFDARRQCLSLLWHHPTSPGSTRERIFASGGLLLSQRRNQRVRKNVQGLVKVGPCVFGGHAGAKTDSILRYSRIIHRRNPKTAPPKFMPQPIHALSISNDNGHHIRCRCSGVEPEGIKLRMEIIGVLPKLRTQFRLAGAELQCFQNGRDHHRWQRTGINVRMRVETQVLQCLLRTSNKASERAESFGERPIDEWDAFFYTKMLSGSTTMFAACQCRVRFINKNARAVRLCYGKQLL